MTANFSTGAALSGSGVDSKIVAPRADGSKVPAAIGFPPAMNQSSYCRPGGSAGSPGRDEDRPARPGAEQDFSAGARRGGLARKEDRLDVGVLEKAGAEILPREILAASLQLYGQDRGAFLRFASGTAARDVVDREEAEQNCRREREPADGGRGSPRRRGRRNPPARFEQPGAELCGRDDLRNRERDEGEVASPGCERGLARRAPLLKVAFERVAIGTVEGSERG